MGSAGIASRAEPRPYDNEYIYTRILCYTSYTTNFGSSPNCVFLFTQGKPQGTVSVGGYQLLDRAVLYRTGAEGARFFFFTPHANVIISGLDSLGLGSLTSEALQSAMTLLPVHKMR